MIAPVLRSHDLQTFFKKSVIVHQKKGPVKFTSSMQFVIEDANALKILSVKLHTKKSRLTHCLEMLIQYTINTVLQI